MTGTEETIKEIYSANVKIKGNALIYNKKIYQVSNISTVESINIYKDIIVTREEAKSEYFNSSSWDFKKEAIINGIVSFLIYIAVICVAIGIVFLLDYFFGYELLTENLEGYFRKILLTLLAIPVFAAALFFLYHLVIASISILLFLLDIYGIYFGEQKTRQEAIYGAHIVFTNGMNLAFIASKEFVEEVVSQLYSVISTSGYTSNDEITINFKDESLNIDNIKDSVIATSDVSGEINNSR